MIREKFIHLTHILNYADQRDGITRLGVVLISTEDVGLRHNHMKVVSVGMNPRFCRNLRQKSSNIVFRNIFHIVETTNCQRHTKSVKYSQYNIQIQDT